MFIHGKKGNTLKRTFYQSLALKKVTYPLIIIFAFSWGVFFSDFLLPLNIEILTLVGVSLAVFLGFYNNVAYKRFKESKVQWAKLTAHSRSLTFQILRLKEDSPVFNEKDKQQAINIIIAYCFALNKYLKNKSDWEDLSPLLSEQMYNKMLNKSFKTTYLLNELTNWVNQQIIDNRIDSFISTSINKNIEGLSCVLGVCERIVDTKIPFVYSVLLHRTIYVYCFILAFGLLESMTWGMPFFVLFVSYTFISLDAIVTEIANPFGDKGNHLDINQMCNDINESLSEISGAPILSITRR